MVGGEAGMSVIHYRSSTPHATLSLCNCRGVYMRTSEDWASVTCKRCIDTMLRKVLEFTEHHEASAYRADNPT